MSYKRINAALTRVARGFVEIIGERSGAADGSGDNPGNLVATTISGTSFQRSPVRVALLHHGGLSEAGYPAEQDGGEAETRVRRQIEQREQLAAKERVLAVERRDVPSPTTSAAAGRAARSSVA
jgi:hypothetical protein